MQKLKRCAFSVESFHSFLAEASHTGVLPLGKAQRWQETLQEFQAVLQAEERDDLRRLDVEALSERYTQLVARQNVRITPWLIQSRKAVLQQAVGNFIAYAINPLKYCQLESAEAMAEGHHQSFGYSNRSAMPAAVTSAGAV